jgi:hypothetical protein
MDLMAIEIRRKELAGVPGLEPRTKALEASVLQITQHPKGLPDKICTPLAATPRACEEAGSSPSNAD